MAGYFEYVRSSGPTLLDVFAPFHVFAHGILGPDKLRQLGQPAVAYTGCNLNFKETPLFLGCDNMTEGAARKCSLFVQSWRNGDRENPQPPRACEDIFILLSATGL